jgi:hypothetical protein
MVESIYIDQSSFVKNIVQLPILAWFRILAPQFKALHGIPHVTGAIDGSHIPTLAPVIGGEDYYCRKAFLLSLLQGTINTRCVYGMTNLYG